MKVVLAVVAVLFGVLWLVARTQPRSPSGAVSVRDSITEATHERLRATYDAVPAWAFRDSFAWLLP